MTPRVVVFDYGSGNVRSAERALEKAGASVRVTASVSKASAAEGVVVPGVGAFAACMSLLLRVGADRLVSQRLAVGGPVLGICVGHQILFACGDENGPSMPEPRITPGLGVWPGSVTAVRAPVLPHIGWNTVSAPAGSAMFAEVAGERFYFVHSYAAHEAPTRSATGSGPPTVTWASYGDDTFVAAVEDGPLWSTQFHPEKSGSAGIALLRSWVATL